MTEDQPLPSPRTPEQPMAFTRDELLHGAVAAWIAFAALLFLCTTVITLFREDSLLWFAPLAGLLSVLVGGAAFGLLMPFGVLLVWPIGRALRRTRRPWVHILVFAALGALLAASYVALLRGPQAFAPLREWDLLLIPPVVAVIMALPIGWAIAARTALRRDRGVIPRRRSDPDADFEDAAMAADRAEPRPGR